MNEVIAKVEREKLSNREVDFTPGDTINVSLKIREGDKERVQAFQGTVVQINGAGRSKSVTVRKPSGNLYVEKIFPINSPMVTEIKLIRKGKVRRARLYYLRQLAGKATRIDEQVDVRVEAAPAVSADA